MHQRSFLLLFLFSMGISCIAQEKSGCGENLNYGFKYYGQLVEEESSSPYYSYTKYHEILVNKVDTIILSASSGGGSCYFCLGPLQRNSEEMDVFEHHEYSTWGHVKFMGRPGDYFIRACATQSFGYSHSISFKIVLYEPGTLDPETQSTGIETLKADEKSRPNPVPFTDFLNISINEDRPPSRVSLLNSTGQVVFLKEYPQQNFVINAGHLNKGIYIVRYRYPDSQENFKVIKN